MKVYFRKIALLMLTSCLISACSFNPFSRAEEETPEVKEELPAISIPEAEEEQVYINQTEDALSEDPVQEAETGPVTVSMLFAGDIAFDDRYANMVSLRQRGSISDCIDHSLIDRMNAADICMINNEFPYSNRGTPTPNKKFTFRAKPETVEYLKVLGVDIVGLANNHAYDHGEEALLDTFDVLKGAGIPYVGAGHNIDEADDPYYIEVNGVKIGFACATQIERSLPPDTKEATETSPGVLRTLDPEHFLETIREADENADFTVVFVHWGTENEHDMEASQRELAEAYAEAGADLIIGAHPHVLQGFGYAEGVPVMYSLGNFWFNSKTMDNCVVEAEVTSDEDGVRLSALRFVPCLQKGCYTYLLEPGSGEHERVMNFEREHSPDVSIDDEGYIRSGKEEEEKEEAEEEEYQDQP